MMFVLFMGHNPLTSPVDYDPLIGISVADQLSDFARPSGSATLAMMQSLGRQG
jgi:hypothetical protein